MLEVENLVFVKKKLAKYFGSDAMIKHLLGVLLRLQQVSQYIMETLCTLRKD